MAFDPNTAKLSSFDPSTAKEYIEPVSSPTTNQQPVQASKPVESKEDNSYIWGRNEPSAVKAVGQSVAQGLGDAGLDFADLAADVLSKLGAEKTGQSLKIRTQAAKAENAKLSQDQIANPVSSGIGGGLGYTAGMIAAPAKGVRALESALGLGGAAARAPIRAGAIREGAVGAIQGAAMQPENREGGALIGSLIGGAGGAIGGGISKFLQNKASQIQPQVDAAERLKVGANSEAGLAATRGELASGGKSQLKDDITSKIISETQQAVDDIKPTSANIPDKSPNQILVDRQQANFANVVRAKDEAYAPLNTAPGTIETTSIKDLSNGLLKKTKSYLPDSELATPIFKGEATFNQLQQYRQSLDQNIRAAQSAKIIPNEVKKLYNIRAQVSAKMSQVADDQGLGGQFQQAEDIYKTQYKPFETFTKSGKLATPEQADEAWFKVNKLLNANNPNPKELRDLVSTLSDEGKDLVGWAKIQNALTKATSGSDINLGAFNKEINQFKVTGLKDVFSKPEYDKAILGINRIVNDGKKLSNVKVNKLNIPIVTNTINYLLQSSPGIRLIIKLGSTAKNSKEYRAAISSLINGAANITTQKATGPMSKPNES